MTVDLLQSVTGPLNQLLDLRSRAVSGRSIIFPHGNEGVQFVKTGNLLLARTVMLLLLAASRGCRYLLEQPGSSCLPVHPRFSWFVERVEVSHLQYFLG